MPQATQTKDDATPNSWQDRKRYAEERSQTLADMQTILKDAEADKGRDLTAEENAKFDELNTRAESLATKIEKYDRLIEARGRFGNSQAPESRSQRPGQHDIVPGASQEPADAREEKRSQAFDSYLRFGVSELTPEERSYLTFGDGLHVEERAVSRGSTIWGTRGFQTELIKSLRDFAGVIEAGARTLTTSNGNEIAMLTVDDTASEGSDEKAEGSAAADDATNPFGNAKLSAFTYDSDVVLVPYELLQDSEVDLSAEILDLAAERIGVKLNKRTTLGTGTGQPQGFLTAAGVGKTAVSQTALTYEELLDFFHSVPSVYRRRGGTWQLNDQTLAAIRKLKDGDGRYIFAAGTSGAPSLILDKPYVVNPDMPDIAAGAKPLAFGDFSRYRVRYVANPFIKRLEEAYATKRSVGFYVAQRADGRLTDARAVKSFAMAAAA